MPVIIVLTKRQQGCYDEIRNKGVLTKGKDAFFVKKGRASWNVIQEKILSEW